MSRMLAVEWDPQEIRYLIASARGGALGIESVGSRSLEGGNGGDSDVAQQAGAVLREIVKEHRLGRARILAGIDRSRCEVLTLSLPPADDADLPALVMHQAIRESPAITEESAVDFIPLGDNPAEPRDVLAVAASALALEQTSDVFNTAGVALHRLVPRPFASASRWADVVEDRLQSALLVHVMGDQADLTLVASGQVRFLRTVRLPAHAQPDSAAASLVAEINRTLLIASTNATDAAPAERVCVFGAMGDHQPLLSALGNDGLEASLVDPFDGSEINSEHIPENAGRFASLLGMAACEARGQAPSIDLMHPRQAAKQPGRKRPLAVAAAVLGLLILGAGGFVWQKLADADRHNVELADQLKELDALVKKQAKKKELYAAIEEWEAGNIVWLDELRDLSLKFPSARDAVVLRMSMTPARSGGGIVTLQGLARDPTVVEDMEQHVRDEYREVTTPRVQQRKQNETYAWHLDTSIFVKKREPAEYQGSAPSLSARLRETERTAQQPHRRSRQVLHDSTPGDRP